MKNSPHPPQGILDVISCPSILSLSPHECEPLCGPGPDGELVLLLIKATDAISLEWVAQTGLPLGNQFAMADARGGKNLRAAQQLFTGKHRGARGLFSHLDFTTLLCFEPGSIACPTWVMFELFG